MKIILYDTSSNKSASYNEHDITSKHAINCFKMYKINKKKKKMSPYCSGAN